MAAILLRPNRSMGRMRLLVLQVLMVSLFLTLFARLWYLQVLTGDEYQAKAAEQSVRDVVVQPTRGLIVDAMGRPLVTNRTSWVISVDRTVLGKLSDHDRRALLRSVAAAVGEKFDVVLARTRLCGTDGAKPGFCWNGSPFQPIPVATDVPQTQAVRISERPEDFPGVIAEAQSVRAYPSPFGVNAAGLLGYLSPITAEELAQATTEEDASVNGASVVGRAGLEKTYDRYLRGMPGYQQVAVDSMGRVLGESGTVAATPGDTLVTSIDAKLQGTVERELAGAMRTARGTFDKITGRNYEADSGAAIVMEARTGRIVAMASAPTYDPSVWVNGISTKQLAALTDEKNGLPLIPRATQGMFAPASTWKPFVSVGALSNGYSPSTRLDCSSGLQVGNRFFKNYESAAYGMIDFARALEISCDTFYYRIALAYWNKFGSDPANVKAKDPMVAIGKEFGFGRRTGIDLPGEAAGRIADRKWKLDYWNSMKAYYCKVDRENTTGKRDFLHVYAREFCLEGNRYKASDAVNYIIGQGDTTVTPLQVARAYAALANGGTLYAPRVAKAVVDPQGRVVKKLPPVVQSRIASKEALRYIDEALLGTAKTGTLAWRFGGFPLDKVQIRAKTGTAEVYGKQTTSWLATYDKDYVVVMMISQAGTGSGASGPAVRAIWEALYGIDEETVRPDRAVIPGITPPKRLPTFTADGSILPPVTGSGGTR